MNERSVGTIDGMKQATRFLFLVVISLWVSTGYSADPVGESTCLTCHVQAGAHFAHTSHARAFRGNPRNALEAQVCEACHGPGSDHVQDPTAKGTLIAFTRNGGTPVAEQNERCLSCHRGGAHLHWDTSIHAISDVACSDCHNPMARLSGDGLLREHSVSQTCYGCHQEQRMDFLKRSHMPLPEGRMSCADCHAPHGSVTEPLLKADSLNQLCYQCHAEKRGPFIWEHAPVREDCSNCHRPHGSNHEYLLVTARPFLCQQCHSQLEHPSDLLTVANTFGGANVDERLANRSCQNCHSQIHGSNHPAGVKGHR